LGATGLVGQNYLRLLANHPWFEVTYLAASARSAGQTFADAVAERWQMNTDIPRAARSLKLEYAENVAAAAASGRLVFSALELDTKDALRELENKYAARDLVVVSNASAHRDTDDVPMLIPEINAEHLKIIPFQQKHRGWQKGFVVVKPNCSLQSYLTPIYALMRAGFEVKKLLVTTMQAISGAGYPGVPSLDIVDNIIPFIKGEEEKTEREPLKILGEIEQEKFTPWTGLNISAHCNRVPVADGHTCCVSVLFGEAKPSREEILKIWRDFRSVPQELKLPSAPEQPIHYRAEDNRPQPKKDRERDLGMAVSVGRLRSCPVFDYKFVGLTHNTVRGAAGGGILNAELLVAQNYLI